jgi:hypothetical protein
MSSYDLAFRKFPLFVSNVEGRHFIVSPKQSKQPCLVFGFFRGEVQRSVFINNGVCNDDAIF